MNAFEIVPDDDDTPPQTGDVADPLDDADPELFLPPPGAWAESGACRDADPEIFFPGRGEDTTTAKAMCATCPVRANCLEHAIRVGEKFGIWGGMSERQRRRVRHNTLRRTA